MAEDVRKVENECSRRILYKDGRADRVWFMFDVKRGSDYVRISKPNEVRMLSAKIAGVVLSANLCKPGFYDHDNAYVAEALRRLAEIVEHAPFRVADNDGDLAVGK